MDLGMEKIINKIFNMTFPFKIFTTITLVIIGLNSCSKNTNDEISPCLKEKIEAFKSDSKSISIKKFRIDEEYHYWFETGAVTYDGKEDIYNNSCEIVCGFCGYCVPNKCTDDYPSYGSDKWEIYWEK